MLTRKQILKMAASLPFVGGITGLGLMKESGSERLLSHPRNRDYFREMGLRKTINARGTFTVLTGSLMEPAVIDAIVSVSDEYVNLIDLRDRAGERIAELLNCEAAMVTAGAASALTLGTAGAITGTDQDLIRELPNLPGPQREVIIQSSHRFGYDHAVRNCGVKLVEVDSARDMQRKINENTVLALYFNAASEHLIDRERFISIGKKHQVPTFNDAAADVPPVENLFKYIEMGFDLVTFSGGKAIRGPQSAGLLFGRADLIEAAKLNHSPYGNSIGRGMKVNKEEIVGMMVALEHYLNKDHEAEWKEWLRRVQVIRGRLSDLPAVETERVIPEGPSNVFPGCSITWNERSYPVSYSEMVEALRNGHPSIETAGGRDDLYINVSMMKSEEADVVGLRIREELEQAAV